ncbi:DNA-binding response regulator [Actinobacteria bacterium YIM 96077]|uniref:DNA-binding response regulator n=1 Tax=Phytoactinopolyspora halophila TaxID=1981511 RepID=A0A329QTU5_9ACTN|nr:response regulator transcription factor [Phytoactinopolyspora halophila]AYY14529.1 DNA-binding response regulator [Actinobacteria bacterium YIM 96077]RAW14138.1 DNA-binding response regulator [Phytoactinopolyspora halophila]
MNSDAGHSDAGPSRYPQTAHSNTGHSNTGSRVLVIDDDPALADVVCRYLRRDGFAVDYATDGLAGLKKALATLPDIVVLDLMLPGMDGLEVCRRLRQVAPIPVVMLTALGEESDRIAGLEIGADDYVTKPFSPRELAARVRAVLRRAAGGVSHGGSEVLCGGGIEIDVVGHQVHRRGEPVSLTAKEFDLLVYLLAHPGRAFRREELLEAVWGWSFGDTSTVTVHIRRLREKVEDDASAPQHLKTVRGVGYRFEP